jgi:hypothetical protein
VNTPASRAVLRSPTWVEVPLLDAKGHVLYGVRGWLLVLVAWFVSPVAVNVIGALLAALQSGVSRFAYWKVTTLSKTIFFVQAASAFLFLMLLAGKVRSFRLATILLVLATTLVSAATAARISIESGIPVSANLIVGPAFFFIAWTLYLDRSVRVRVTFEHKLPSPVPDERQELGAAR